mmetsp:Transcript_2493/g.3327  ORF Transcript_2493/g.3327 Transcript_2493/m.3327 type:complete len:149 (+) Transcript_2493:70-516(+)
MQKSMKRFRAQRIEVSPECPLEAQSSNSNTALSTRKPLASAPVDVPRPQAARHGMDISSACSVSPSANYNYDLATWRMYCRITTARARRTAMVPAPQIRHQVPSCAAQYQYYGQYRPSSTLDAGIQGKSASLNCNDTQYDGEVFTLEI